MRKQFYLDLVTRLKGLKDAQEEEIIRHYDLWNQQLNPDFTESFDFPAVFLEYRPIEWKTLGRLRQEAFVVFHLHICTSTMAKSSDKSIFKDRVLDHLDLLDAIHKWLTGWRGDYFGSIYRIGSIQDHFYADKIQHVEIYRMQLVDDSAMRDVIIKESENELVLNISFDV